ncbi:hypothetical protein ASPACDRAFT_57935 [Aspergillus aculeatus ATCC 16872]|uniref:Major facilitator superfamily (MFS) profile domain-containing protein n=1 Tax=Aspergillus aculeatus (strain ATCC 16872 / CBS 172.66 / WB 5094) TaxID=690307 RepID=A0A1L9X3B3_ASPA1|nr:uncharacterized protein ASPACDRAFT_57935 [Aspergillus aculeatus ATCC 16872]OJK02967.1 hypothetical protein ASPACDRAFT_57935 [Aspergillus aculeatus ATCC 16872]
MEKAGDTYNSHAAEEAGFSSAPTGLPKSTSGSTLPPSDSKPGATSSPSPSSARTITGIRWIGVCIPLYVSLFVYGLDATIAADVQSTIVEQFGEVDELSWIGFGFPLGSVAVIGACDVLYARFHMKWSYIGSTVIFAAGSALCGAAPNMAALIVGRVFAGAGGSGLYMGCLNLFTSFTNPKERGAYITGTGITWGLGAVLGPWGWADGRTIATIVVSAVLWVLWGVQQAWCILTTLEDRCVPVQLLRSRSQILLYVATSSTITCLFIVVYYVPIYFHWVYAVASLKAPGQEGGALCLQNFAQIGGSVIALVIAGQAFQTYAQSGLTAALAGTGYTTADIQSIVTGAQSALFQNLDAEHKMTAILAFTKAMQKVFILVCVGGGTHLVASLLMKGEKLAV